jgi:hypothetical protein
MIAAPVLIISSAATAMAMSGSGADSDPQATPSRAGLESTLSSRSDAYVAVSRSGMGGRAPVDDIEAADPRSVDTEPMFVTTALNVWSGPGERFKLKTVLRTGTKIAATGIDDGRWTQIVYNGKFAWVNAAYVAKRKPAPDDETASTKSGDVRAPSSAVTEAPCRLGSGVEVGLTADAIRVYRSVCAQFPEVTSYGGVRPDGGEHSTGQALDIMVSSGSLGDAIAAYVRANAAKLGVSEILWAQQIWTVERSSEGWRGFADRGSDTANHFDHVHVTVYGNSGG